MQDFVHRQYLLKFGDYSWNVDGTWIQPIQPIWSFWSALAGLGLDPMGFESPLIDPLFCRNIRFPPSNMVIYLFQTFSVSTTTTWNIFLIFFSNHLKAANHKLYSSNPDLGAGRQAGRSKWKVQNIRTGGCRDSWDSWDCGAVSGETRGKFKQINFYKNPRSLWKGEGINTL